MSLLPCPRCATPLLPNTMGCTSCGAPIDEGAEVRPLTMMIMGLSLAGCPVYDIQPEYGIAISDTGFTDNDGDGFSPRDGDCNDNSPTIHPEAEEIPEDGVDANCNGEDDT